jgi:glycosyltransferase 2 family protein
MNDAVTYLAAHWRRFRSSIWARVAEFVIIGLSLILMISSLARNLNQVDLTTVQLNPWLLILATLVTSAAVWLGALAWVQIVQAFRPSTAKSFAIRAHMLSLAVKYLPGVGWQQVSKTMQLSEVGSNWRGSVAPVMLELALVLVTGFGVMTLLMPWLPPQLHWAAKLITVQPVLLLFSWGLCIMLPFVAFNLFSRNTLQRVDVRRFLFHTFLAEVLLAISWFIFGVHLWLLVGSFTATTLALLPYMVFTLILSFIVSLAIVVVPNGVFVREFFMYSMLGMVCPVGISVICATLSRVVLVVSEIMCAFPFVINRFSRQNNKD